jgi:hypothetical protein
MDMETIASLTVLVFGNICLIFVIVWMIQTWREEIARNRSKGNEKPQSRAAS